MSLKKFKNLKKNKNYTFIIGPKSNSFVAEEPARHFTSAVISHVSLELVPGLVSHDIRKYVTLVPHCNQIDKTVRSKLLGC